MSVISQFSSVAQLCLTLRPHGLQHARPPCPSLTPRSLLRLMSIESVMPSSHLILCHPLLLLPSVFPSIRVFSNESVLRIRWPKYWSFSISPYSEYSGLISFRMDSGLPFFTPGYLLRDRTLIFCVSCIGRKILYPEPSGKPLADFIF